MVYSVTIMLCWLKPLMTLYKYTWVEHPFGLGVGLKSDKLF